MTSDSDIHVIEQCLKRAIAFHRVFVSITGSVTAGLFLSQSWYWRDKGQTSDGWFFKTRDEWFEETGLTRCEQESARKVNRDKKFIEERYADSPRRLYFRVNVKAVVEAIKSLPVGGKPAGGKPANKLVENQPASRRETSQQAGGKPADSCKEAEITQRVQQRLPERETRARADATGDFPQLEIYQRYYPHVDATAVLTEYQLNLLRSMTDLAACERALAYAAGNGIKPQSIHKIVNEVYANREWEKKRSAKSKRPVTSLKSDNGTRPQAVPPPFDDDPELRRQVLDEIAQRVNASTLRQRFEPLRISRADGTICLRAPSDEHGRFVVGNYYEILDEVGAALGAKVVCR